MNFQVPQFIETEDKIVGPFTLRQFLYIAVGGSVCFALFFFMQLWLWIIVAFFIMTIFSSLAFIKVSGRPLPTIVMAAIGFYWKPKFYLWKRKEEVQKEKEARAKVSGFGAAELRSKLDNLWDQIKTSKNPIPKREKSFQPTIMDRTRSSKERFEMMRKITGEKEMAKRIDYK